MIKEKGFHDSEADNGQWKEDNLREIKKVNHTQVVGAKLKKYKAKKGDERL